MSNSANEGAGKRALITGLHGFTGRHLAEELRAAGYRVFGADLVAAGGEIDVFSVDLCDRAAVAALIDQVRPDVVAHLAGISFVAHSDSELVYRVNIVGTRNLLEALAACPHKPESVLLASSAHIYGNADVELIDESLAPSPMGDYAVSKLAMEYMARLWNDKLPITIVRPFNYIGVGQHENFLLPKIVSHFRREARSIELGNLNIARDFSDVRVVSQVYRRLLQGATAGQSFNICSGRAHSLAEVLACMADIAGYQIDVKVNPAFVRDNDVLRLTGNRAKLDAAIGVIEPMPLADTLRWMYLA